MWKPLTYCIGKYFVLSAGVCEKFLAFFCRSNHFLLFLPSKEVPKLLSHVLLTLHHCFFHLDHLFTSFYLRKYIFWKVAKVAWYLRISLRFQSTLKSHHKRAIDKKSFQLDINAHFKVCSHKSLLKDVSKWGSFELRFSLNSLKHSKSYKISSGCNM